MDPRAATAASRRRRRAVALAALATILLGGCGLRLETPPPSEPDPDALEIVRRTAVADALFVAEQADGAVVTLAGKRPRLVTELERVAEDSREQAEQLGGSYVSGLDPEGPTGSPEPSEDPVSPEDVVVALVDASGRSRIAAGSTDDGPLARLLASIGAAQTVSAVRVGDFTDEPAAIGVDPVVPAPQEAVATADPSDDGAESASVEATHTSRLAERATGAVEQGTEEPDAPQDAATDEVSSTVPDPVDPPVLPRGLTAADLATLVESEDSAAYALDLRAALRDDDARASLAERAQAHDERSRAWAVVAGTAGTEQDPRQVAYAVPRGSEDDVLVRAIEDDLATGYATLVGTTAVGTRTVLVDLLVDSALTLQEWGAEPVPFPGLPERLPQ